MALKRERRSSVMMSVMFLLISAVIATPFAIGMVSVYAGFMKGYGMTSDIIFTAPVAGEMYMIIHSILVAFIISIIMYGDVKKESNSHCPWRFHHCNILFHLHIWRKPSYRGILMDNKGQASSEFILLFGGIIVVVLLAIHLYNQYMNDLSGEIASKEVNEFNSELLSIGKYFK